VQHFLGVAGQGVYKTNTAGSEWTKVKDGGNDTRYQIVRIASSNTVFVDGGILLNGSPCVPTFPEQESCTGIIPLVLSKTIDGGQSWQDISSLGGILLSDMAVDRSNPNTIYFSTIGSGTVPGRLFAPKGVFRTQDGGSNWVQINQGLPSPISEFVTTDIAIDPAAPNTLLVVASPNLLYKSKAAGSCWTSISPPNDVTVIMEVVIAANHQTYILTPQGLYVLK
jgi:photosystem II stability/assembly factor-like uncharacterized protein